MLKFYIINRYTWLLSPKRCIELTQIVYMKVAVELKI